MINESDRRAIVFTVLAGALVWLGVIYSREPAKVLSPKTSAQLERLDATKPAHDSTVAARVAVDDQRLKRDADLRRAIAQSHARADAERHRADSLAAVAALTTGDADAWQAAYESRTAENAELRATNAKLAQRSDSLETSNRDLRFDRDSVFRPRIDSLNAALRSVRVDVAKVEQCRILPGIRCPSRKEAAVGGVIIGVITGTIAASRSGR